MNYFVFSGMAIFLLVMLFIDKFKLFIGVDFREGIAITPIILMANLFVGIFFNLSIWYKLTNKTMFGAYLVIIGASLTIIVNYLFVPVYGFYASAWGHIISYSVMVILSFIYGQKHYTIPYDLKRILLYIIIAFTFYLISLKLNIDSLSIKYLINSMFILTYFGVFYLSEKRRILIKL
jgi:O-antigen/teichoic acid export membrane protein